MGLTQATITYTREGDKGVVTVLRHTDDTPSVYKIVGTSECDSMDAFLTKAERFAELCELTSKLAEQEESRHD